MQSILNFEIPEEVKDEYLAYVLEEFAETSIDEILVRYAIALAVADGLLKQQFGEDVNEDIRTDSGGRSEDKQ